MTGEPLTPQQAACHLVAILERDGARFRLHGDEFTVCFATVEQRRTHGPFVASLRNEIGALLFAQQVIH